MTSVNKSSSGKIDIIDFFSNKKISEIDENLIFRNNSLEFLKKMIVRSYPDSESFLIHQDSIALGDGARYITDMSQVKKGQGKIAVFNLLNEITNYVFENAHIFIDPVYNESFVKFFKSLKNIYAGLTEDFLRLCIGYLLYTNTGAKSFKEDSDAFIKIVRENKKGLDSIKIGDTVSQNLYKVFKTRDNSKILDYSLTNVLLNFKLDVPDDKKLRNETLSGYIIKNIKLDDTICAMASKDHGVKSDKSISKKLLSEWFLDKTETQEGYSIKNIRGLIVKIKADNYRGSGDYYTGVISNSSSGLIIRINWPLSQKADFLKVYSMCSKSLAVLFCKLKEIGVEITNFRNSTRVCEATKLTKDEIFSFISYSSLTFFTKDFYQIKKLSVIERKFPQFIREDSPEKLIKFKYQSPVENLGISIRSIQLVTEGISKKTNAIEVINGTPYTNYELVLGELSDLFIETVGKKVIVFEEGRLKELQEPSKKSLEKKITKKNIKILGDVVDSVSCQKKRQPKIMDENKTSIAKDSRIIWNGKEYYCENKDFLYPGFTSKRSLCCFTKPQKDKEIYKNMMATQKTSRETVDKKYDEDSHIISSSRIIKNIGSVIQPEKLGKVSPKITEIFDSKGKNNDNDKRGIFRLGIKNNTDIKENFLRAVTRAIGILENNQKVRSLYKILDENKDMDSRDFFRTVVLRLGINVVVINSATGVNGLEETILCDIAGVDLIFQDTVFLIKSFEYIFDLVVLSDGKKLTKYFDKKSNIYSSFYKNYKTSCVIKYNRKNKPNVPTIKKLLEMGLKPVAQFSTKSGTVLYIAEEKLGIVPVVPYNYLLPNVVNFVEIKDVFLQDIRKKRLVLENSGIKGYSVDGYIKDKGGKNKTSKIVLSCGIIVPILSSSLPEDIKEIRDPMYYGIDIDNILQTGNISSVPDYFDRHTSDLKKYEELYINFKELIVAEISNKNSTYKENIRKIIDLGDKKHIIVKIKAVLEKYLSTTYKNISKKLLDNFIKRLTNEIVIEKNKIINGTWSKYPRNSQNFIIRDTEIILITQEDIKKYLSK